MMETEVLPSSTPGGAVAVSEEGEESSDLLPYTQADLKKWFRYDPACGDLFWTEEGLPHSGKVEKTWCRAGELACIERRGKRKTKKHKSVVIYVGGNRYEHRAHRVVWVLHHGRLPTEAIEHINGNRFDNRIENLRAERFDWQAMSDQEADVLYMTYFANFRSKEPMLYRVKWWDYRAMHPIKASFAFADAYTEAYRYMTAIRVDVRKAPYVNGLSRGVFVLIEPAERTGLNTARIVADRYGIPYDFWCREAMRYAESMSWENMPRPQQLYSPEFINHILLRWEREQAVSLRLATHTMYAPDSHTENPDHQEYQRYLIEHVRQPASEIAQAQRLCSLMHLMTEKSLLEFSEITLREAKRLRSLFSQR